MKMDKSPLLVTQKISYRPVGKYPGVSTLVTVGLGIYLLIIFLFTPDPVVPHHDDKGHDSHSKPEAKHEQTEKAH